MHSAHKIIPTHISLEKKKKIFDKFLYSYEYDIERIPKKNSEGENIYFLHFECCSYQIDRTRHSQSLCSCPETKKIFSALTWDSEYETSKSIVNYIGLLMLRMMSRDLIPAHLLENIVYSYLYNDRVTASNNYLLKLFEAFDDVYLVEISNCTKPNSESSLWFADTNVYKLKEFFKKSVVLKIASMMIFESLEEARIASYHKEDIRSRSIRLNNMKENVLKYSYNYTNIKNKMKIIFPPRSIDEAILSAFFFKDQLMPVHSDERSLICYIEEEKSSPNRYSWKMEIMNDEDFRFHSIAFGENMLFSISLSHFYQTGTFILPQGLLL